MARITENAVCHPCDASLWKGEHESHHCVEAGCACPVCHSSAKELLEVLDAIDNVIDVIEHRPPPSVPRPRPAGFLCA